VVYGTTLLGARFSKATRRGRALTHALNWWGLPFLSLPPLVAVARPLFERRHPQMAVIFPLLIGALWGVFVYRQRFPRWLEGIPTRIRAAFALVVLTTAYVAYGVFFSRLAITNHHALNTATFDLGLYDNIFYQSLHGTP